MHVCSGCGDSLENYHPSRQYCDECKKKRKIAGIRRWQIAHPDEERERSARWREVNPERHRESVHQAHDKNSEHYREYSRRYKKDNPEKIREYDRRWKSANPDKIAEYNHRSYIKGNRISKSHELNPLEGDGPPERDHSEKN